MCNQRERHDLTKNRQPDQLVTHPQGERGLLDLSSSSAELFRGCVGRNRAEHPIGTDELRILKGTDQLSAGGVAPLHAKLPQLREAEDNRRNHRNDADDLRYVCQRLQLGRWHVCIRSRPR